MPVQKRIILKSSFPCLSKNRNFPVMAGFSIIGRILLITSENERSCFYLKKRKVFGTGSYPPSLMGLHLIILVTESKRPLIKPCFFNASIEYSEHVG